MNEGFYSITYGGAAPGLGGIGFGVIALDTGKVIGADVAGGRYDGVYEFDQTTSMINATVNVTVPAGVALVTGFPAQP